MNTRCVWMLVIVATSLGGWTGFSLADEEAAGGPSHEEMMAELIKLHAPGPAQAVMDPLAGEWDAKTYMHMEPGKPPQEGTGSARNEWIHEGRMMRVSFEGDFMGMPFRGEGHMGHDNFVKEYQSTWTDSMSSNIYTSTGSWNAEAKQLTLKGVWKGPMGDMPQRMVYTLVGPDEYTLESYGTMGEQEMLQMKMVFTRKAAAATAAAASATTTTRCCPPRRARIPYTGSRRP